MIINNELIEPGQNKKIEVTIASLPSHTPINMSINVARGKNPGPILLLMAGLHGDEINGIETIRRIIENKWNIPESGTIICIPIINLYGFIHFSRYVPDGKDVNRSFPGNKSGSLASRVASYITRDILPKIDHGLDFHTGGADRSNYPQIRCLLNDPKNAELSNVFSAPFIINSPLRAKSLRQTAAKMKKQILVFEGGESARFDEFAIQEGLNGALRVINHLKMATINVPAQESPSQKIIKSGWVRAKVSGLFHLLIKNGAYVQKNQQIGFITDPFADFKIMVKSPYEGYIIGRNNAPLVHQGDALIHIGKV